MKIDIYFLIKEEKIFLKFKKNLRISSIIIIIIIIIII